MRVPSLQSLVKRGRPVGLSILAAGLAFLLSAYLIGQLKLNDGLISTLISVGLDPQRGHLVSVLLLTLLVSLGATLCSRQRIVVVLAALLYFWRDYLSGFTSDMLKPLRDPGGRLEPLDSSAFFHTIVILLALAILASCIGIALGLGLSRLLFDPVFALFMALRRRWSNRTMLQGSLTRTTVEPHPARIVGGLAQAVLFLTVLFLAANSANLFLYGPDDGLHLAPAISTRNGVPQKGTVVQDSYISPALNGQKRNFAVYLPPTYNTPEARNIRYPVLFMLHGSPGHIMNWVTAGKAVQSADTLIGLGKIPELILVMPDGNGRSGQTSEWGDSGDKKQLMESSIVRDLVPYIDKHYRTLATAKQRGIGGLSMGGFGAANIGIHHPDVFGFVIALGGYYYADGNIWGTNKAYRQANSPALVLPKQKRAWQTHYFIGGATKDALYGASIKFSQQLKQLHIPYHFEVQKGYHAWPVWQGEFYNALLWLHTIIR